MIERTEKTYANGIKHVHFYLPFMRSLFISFYVRAGASYETKKEQWGAAHFLEHMLFNGSENYPSAQEVKSIAGRLGLSENAWTWSDMTQYEIKLNKNHLAKAFDILTQRVYYPLLSEQEIKKEKGIIVEERKRANTSPFSVMYDRSKDILNEGTTYRHPTLGYEDTIKGMNQEILGDYHKAFYHASNSYFVSYGGATYDEVEKIVGSNLGQIKDGQVPAISKVNDEEVALSRETEIVMPSDSAYYMFNGKAELPKSTQQYANYLVLNALWSGSDSSVLRKELEVEQSLVFGMESDIYYNNEMTMWSASCGLEEKNIDKVKELITQLHQSLPERINDSMVENAKNYVYGNFVRDIESLDLPSEISPTNTVILEFLTGLQVDLMGIRELLSQVTLESVISSWENLNKQSQTVQLVLIPKK